MAKPHIIFLNQSISPLFLEMAVQAAEVAGESILYTGSREPGRRGKLEIRHAPSYCNGSEFSRLWTWTLYMLRVAGACLFMKNRPLLFVATNPPFLPFLAYLLHQLRGWPYIILVWDIYPDVLVRFGRLSSKSPIVKIWQLLNRKALVSAEAIITISQGMAETLKNQLNGADQCSITVIPNWVDTTYIHPLPKDENWFAQQYQQVDKLTVVYSGNMGATHDLSTLIEAAKQLEHISGLNFLLIGNGPGRKLVEEAIVEQRVSNLTLLPPQPQEIIPFSMSTGDVAIVSLDKGAEGLSMPSKTYFMLAAGCALLGISHAQSDLARLIADYPVGMNVVPGNAAALVNAIMQFYQDREFLDRCRRQARDTAVRYFSSKRVIQEYQNLLLSIQRNT